MREFLKYTFASLVALLIFMGVSVGGLVFLVLLAASRDPAPRIKDRTVLSVDLGIDIVDTPASETVNLFASNDTPSISLKAALDAIDQAAKDDRIVALYLQGGASPSGTSVGYAALKELRGALLRFKATGKKVIAYDLNVDEQEYYLTSVADTILLHPFGSFEVNGFSSQGTFFTGALEKFGIGVQVTRVGRYKSAVEPFLLTKRSPENQQQTQQLLGDLWSDFLVSVSKERKLTPRQLQAIADQNGILEAENALKRGLVTKLAYEDEVINNLQQIGAKNEDGQSFREVELKTYAKLAQRQLRRSRSASNKIAVVYAEGSIVNGRGESTQVGGDRFARLLRKLREDDDVKAVVLRVNSPGGSATASEIIQREMILTRKVKPVVVSMGSVAASGGYWISTYSDRIFAESNTITGSIGVFGLLPNVQKLANNNGITWDVVKTGRFADLQTITRPKTPQELALIQQSVDRIYDQFLTKVAESRNVSKAKIAQIAQGRVWSGKRAKELGLVDEIGGLDAAIQDAAKRAKLDSNWQLEEHPKPTTLGNLLFGSSEVQATDSWHTQNPFRPFQQKDPILAELKKIKVDLAPLNELNDPKGIYVRLPFDLQID